MERGSFREAAYRIEHRDTSRKISFSRDTRLKVTARRHLFIRGALVARASGTSNIDASVRFYVASDRKQIMLIRINATGRAVIK